MKKLNKLTIQKTGLTLPEFVKKYLNSEPKAFDFRLRKDRLYPAEVLYTCWILGVTCEEAFGRSFTKLVLFRGKYGVSEKVQEIWEKASEEERDQLVAPLGFMKPTPVEIQKLVRESRISNLLDAVSTIAPDEAPKDIAEEDKKSDDFFIETY